MGYGTAWWFWWWAILIVFFFVPLAYGWGMRGWGPWYRRRRRSSTDVYQPPVSDPDDRAGWGWLGIFLWLVLVLEVFWLIAVWGWGRFMG